MLRENTPHPSIDEPLYDRQPAPGFELPGTNGSGWRLYRLDEYTTRGVTIVGFYPADGIERSEVLSWLQFTEGIDVLVLSNIQCTTFDRPELVARNQFPVLGDIDESVARAFGISYSSSGEVVMIDSSGQITHVWPAKVGPRVIYRTARELLDAEATNGDDHQ